MYKKGMKVRATTVITEGGGNTEPDFNAVSFINTDGFNLGFVHADKNECGTIEYVDDDNVPTVRFDRKGTATIVGDDEIEIIGE